MDKKCIQGRRRLVSWHHTAKPFSSSAAVKAIVVQGSTVFLPGEASERGVGRFQSIAQTNALTAGMLQVGLTEESAESIVVVSEPVSSCRPLGVGEDYGKSVRSKARTKEEEATGGAL
jgi:hypothetical protein